MFELSQRDDRWKYKTIGDSMITIGEYGCTITSISMGANILAGHEVLTPNIAAVDFTFNPRGEIVWALSNFEKFGIKFVRRGYGYNKSRVEEYALSRGKMVILEVNHRAHWLVVVGIDQGKLTIIDPIDGRFYSAIPSKYKITGYALFEKVDADVPDWAQESWEKAKFAGLYGDVKPQDDRDLGDFQGSLIKLKKINAKSNVPAYREAVILDNLGLFD